MKLKKTVFTVGSSVCDHNTTSTTKNSNQYKKDTTFNLSVSPPLPLLHLSLSHSSNCGRNPLARLEGCVGSDRVCLRVCGLDAKNLPEIIPVVIAPVLNLPIPLAEECDATEVPSCRSL